MKKVFLSLATIAFVAAGSLTVTSCGSDDSNPGPGPGPGPGGDDNPPVGQADNTVRANGTDSPLDFSYYELITRDYPLVDDEGEPTGETIEEVNVYNYPDGGYANGYYVNVGYNMSESGEADTYHYALVLVQNPSITVEGGVITSFGEPIFPHQAEELFWGQAYVMIDGDEYGSTQNNVGTGSVTVNTLVLNEDLEGTSNFVSQFSIDGADFNFKYNSNTFLTTYNVTPAAKGNNVKKAMLDSVKALELNAKVK